MNILLIMTYITLLLIFVYSYLSISYTESFVVDKMVSSYKLGGSRNTTNNSQTLAEFNNSSLSQYKQHNEFIPDKDNYSVKKDSGLLAEINNPITLMPIEYENLKDRVSFYNKIHKKHSQNRDAYIDTQTNENIQRINKIMIDQLENSRNSNTPLVRIELTVLVLDFILKSIKERFQIPNNINNIIFSKNSDILISPKNLNGYSLCKNWLLEQIYNEITSKNIDIQYTNSDRFIFIYDHILDYDIDKNNYLERYSFISTLYRPQKETNFTVYFSIVFNYNKIEYYLEDVIIIGKNYRQYIEFSKYLDTNYKLDNTGIHLSLSEKNPTYVSDNHITNYREITDKFVEDYFNSKQTKNNVNKIPEKCFFKDALTKEECISYTPEEGTGIWDKQCIDDWECPYFKQNRNYPNSRGGCINGYCEMPINVGLIGFTEYNESDETKAICHNCKTINTNCKGIECSMCCDQQSDKLTYPTLVSPDYAFKSDFDDRIKYKDSFIRKGLTPYNIKI